MPIISRLIKTPNPSPVSCTWVSFIPVLKIVLRINQTFLDVYQRIHYKYEKHIGQSLRLKFLNANSNYKHQIKESEKGIHSEHFLSNLIIIKITDSFLSEGEKRVTYPSIFSNLVSEITGQKEQSEKTNIQKIWRCKAYSPSEGSVRCDAAMKVIRQNETAKAYPWILRAGITVYPEKQPNGRDDEQKGYWNWNIARNKIHSQQNEYFIVLKSHKTR